MRLWVDDLRPPPHDYHVVARNAPDAIHMLLTGIISHVGFDHDYGPCNANAWQWIAEGRLQGIDETATRAHLQTLWNDPDGADAGDGTHLTRWIALAAHDMHLPAFTYSFQSANPVGIRNMRDALQEAQSYWQ